MAYEFVDNSDIFHTILVGHTDPHAAQILIVGVEYTKCIGYNGKRIEPETALLIERESHDPVKISIGDEKAVRELITLLEMSLLTLRDKSIDPFKKE